MNRYRFTLFVFFIAILSSNCQKPFDPPGYIPDDPSSAKAISSFSVLNPASDGVIDETAKTIVVSLPYGTSTHGLVASWVTSAAQIRVGSTAQISGVTINDFATPLVYTAIAEDGTSVDYTVHTNVAPLLDSSKTISSFGFSQAVHVAIDQANALIDATVPFGTDCTKLKATFTMSGVALRVGAVDQVSGETENDFSSPLSYTVVAKDGSLAIYTVSVTVMASGSGKALTDFFLYSPGQMSTKAYIMPNTNEISVHWPYGTARNALGASFTTTAALVTVGGVKQISGETLNDYSDPAKPVVFTLYAGDGSSTQYTVKITIYSDDLLNSFGFNQLASPGFIDQTSQTVSVFVPQNTALTGLAASFTTTDATVYVGSIVQESGVSTNDFNKPVDYKIVAADGSYRIYRVVAVNKTVYVGGMLHRTNTSPESDRAGYWKNGTWIELEISNQYEHESMVYALLLQDNDVYAGGSSANGGPGGSSSPGYWKNDVYTALPYDIQTTRVYALAVSGSTVYAAGYGFDRTHKDYAKLWKDGVLSTLHGVEQESSSVINSLYLDGGDYYAGGASTDANGLGYAGYWKNGVWVQSSQVPVGSSSCVYSIVVAGSSVYAGGRNNSEGGYWKDGVWVKLVKLSSVMCLVVDQGSVYAAGSGVEGGYYKNGDWIAFSPHHYLAKPNVVIVNSLAILDDEVVAVGNYTVPGTSFTRAGFWAKGVWLPLSEFPGSAKAIVLR